MTALAILVLGGLLLAVLAARTAAPGRPRRRGGSGPLGVRSAAEVEELRASLESEDLAQLLAVTNARRRIRGLPERTPEDADRELGAWRGRG